MVFIVVIIIFSASWTTSSMTVNYVKPLNFESTTASPCSEMQTPCLTLNEYTSDRDVYFINNTIFYFYPGKHTLRDSLVLENLHNLSFHGWPAGGDQIVTVMIDSLARIYWRGSLNIEISSINFILHDNFTFIMRFEHSHSLQLSNISIYGNGYSGCSSIISQGSALGINNASFFGIKGYLGAALMMSASNVTFRGSNVFVGNTAASGGSIYLSGSYLVLSGASLFLNNTSSHNIIYSKEVVNKTFLCNYRVKTKGIGSGGAISCLNSCLQVHGHSNFTANIADSHGGAILVDTSELFLQGFTFFSWNVASITGGALKLLNASSNINGSLSLKRNRAESGGGMEVRTGNLSIQGYALFDENTTKYGGGALHLTDSHFEYCGSTSFGNNMASYYQGGGTNTSNVVTVSSLSFIRNVGFGSSILCQSRCTIKLIGTVYFNESFQSAIVIHTSNITFTGTILFYSNKGGLFGGAVRSYDSNIIFSGTVHFERNQAYRGGAMWLGGASKLILKPKLSISFISNHAKDSGGALYFSDSQCFLGSTECFIIIDGRFSFHKQRFTPF